MAIHSDKEFLETFKEGDIIYYIGSFHSKPCVVYGPIKIKKLIHDHPDDEWRMNQGLVRILADNPEYNEWHYVTDLTNRYHGVCKTEEEAKDYLQKRLEEFANDPVWQQEWRHCMELSEMMMDEYDDQELKGCECSKCKERKG